MKQLSYDNKDNSGYDDDERDGFFTNPVDERPGKCN